MRRAAPVIELAGVAKVFRSGDVEIEALRSVDLSVRHGEFVAIMGRSGSGKTTLLGILGCLDRPSSGSYRLDGEEIAGLDEARRARLRGRRIGFVFQAYNLLPRTSAFRNVELPLVYAGVPRAQRAGRVRAALAEVGLSDRLDHVPARLSGGEQQRVAIARALVVEPSVLLLDEPTGNLDSASADGVLRLLERVHRLGATIVMVTHAGEVAERAGRVLRLRDGAIVADERSARRLAARAVP